MVLANHKRHIHVFERHRRECCNVLCGDDDDSNDDDGGGDVKNCICDFDAEVDDDGCGVGLSGDVVFEVAVVMTLVFLKLLL